MPLWLRNSIMIGVFVVWAGIMGPIIYNWVISDFHGPQPPWIACVIPGGTFIALSGRKITVSRGGTNITLDEERGKDVRPPTISGE